jgi:Flp pilus assembly protein TadD
VEQAGRDALALDDSLGLAHAALATGRWTRHFDWDGAEASLERALELAPDDPLVRGSKVFYLIMHERFDEALATWDGIELGSRESVLVRGSSSFAYYFSGRAEQGLAIAEEGLRDAPDSAMLLFHKGLALGHLERFDEAVTTLARAEAIDQELTLAVAVRALYMAQLGRQEEVRVEFERLLSWGGAEPVGPYVIGLAHLARGDVERAIDSWEQAVEEGDFLVPFVRSMPRLRSLRAHPRFQALLQRMWPDHGPFEVGEAT